jgi:hypothetical protein
MIADVARATNVHSARRSLCGLRNNILKCSAPRRLVTPARHTRLCIALLIALGGLTPPALPAEQEPLTLEWSPETITVRHGILGTKKVTFTLTNTSQRPIELPQKQWLVVKSVDSEADLFAPRAQFTPFIIDPGKTVEVTWDVSDELPFPPKREVAVHFRSGGETAAWRRLVKPLVMSYSIVNLAIIIVVCLISVIFGWKPLIDHFMNRRSR